MNDVTVCMATDDAWWLKSGKYQESVLVVLYGFHMHEELLGGV